MKIQSNLVLIKVDPPKEKDESGLYVTEEWRKLPPFGVVETVGIAVMFCKPGDRVWFERFGAIEHPEEADLRLCREDQILGVL